MAVVRLALAWALQMTGTVNLGVNLGIRLLILLGLALLRALFNMFVMPFMGRRRTTGTSATAAGTTILPGGFGTIRPGTAPASGASEHGVVQEPRDKPTLEAAGGSAKEHPWAF
jgi:hypothetical protein